MAKNRKGGSKNDSKAKKASTKTTAPPQSSRPLTLFEWLVLDWVGLKWVCGCLIYGGLFGFLVGTSLVFPGSVEHRYRLGAGFRSSAPYQFFSIRGPIWDMVRQTLKNFVSDYEIEAIQSQYTSNPANSRVFDVLREAVVREKGGFVHPDLGLLSPAPSGSIRGLGMVSNKFYTCQRTCFPGSHEERVEADKVRLTTEHYDVNQTANFLQEEVLIRVPLSSQMTRQAALEKLSVLIPTDVQIRNGFYDLDDAAILVLFLAHERGVGKYSRWLPYIMSLPPEPSCGYSRRLRPHMLTALLAYKQELGVNTDGWPDELLRATQYSERIAEGLNNDYGEYLESPKGLTSLQNIEWALCQVASRATAGSDSYGSLRLVPMVDLINHDSSAGGFVELTGQESRDKGDFVDSTEEDSGTFVVRSLRHGRRKPLKKGQELMANYHVPHYTPLDWLVSLGFIPPERLGPWIKLDSVLPQIRRDGPFEEDNSVPKEQALQESEL